MHQIRILVLPLLAVASACAAASDDAKAALAKLPGMAMAAGQALTGDGSVFTTQVATPAGAVPITIVRGAKGAWLAVVQPPGKADLCPAPLREALGDSRLQPLALIVSSADLQLDPDLLPKALRKPLGGAQVKAGGNLFLDARIGGSGVLAQVRSAIGAGDQPVRITGTCGPELVAGLLGEQGGPPPTCALSVAFPASTPPAFAGLDPAAFSVRFASTSISLGVQGQELRLAGEQGVVVQVLGKPLQIANTLTFIRDGDRYGIACRGTLDLAEDLLGTRQAGFDVRQLVLSGDLAAQGSRLAGFGMAVGAQVDIRGTGRVQGDFAIAVADKAVTELTLSLQTAPGSRIGLGGLPLIKQLPGADQFAFTQLGIGVSPANKEAFLTGTVEWRTQQITAQAALLLGRGSVALFLAADGLTMRKLCPALPPEFDIIPLNRAMLAVSTAPIAGRSPAMLPSPVRAMMASATGRTDGVVGFGDGVTVVTAYAPGGQLGEAMKTLGIGKDPMVLAGSIGGVFAGDPSFALYADLGRLPIPQGGQPGCIAVKQVTPRFFVAARDLRSAPALDAGSEVLAGVRLGDDDLTMGLKTYLTLGQAGGGVRITGTVAGMWTDMLGIPKMDMGDLVLQFGADADGSARIGMGGRLVFNGLTYAGQGLLAVTPAGVPKQFGLALRGDKLSPDTLLRMMEAFVRSAATGPLANAIADARMRKNLAALAAAPSFTDSIGKTIPLDLVELHRMKLFFATPGASDPDLPALNGMGIGVAGTLILDGRIKAAKADVFVTEAMGLRIAGQLADVDLGLVALKNTNLDLRAPMPMQGTPYFKLRGDSTVLLYSGGLDIELSADKGKFVCVNDWGAFGKANIHAETFGGTLLKPKDFLLEVEASADLKGGIRKQLAPAITADLRTIGDAEEQALAAAKADLVTLEKQLAAVRTEAGKNKTDAESAIKAAQKAVDRWDDKLDDIDDDIDDAEDDIETAKDRLQADKVIELAAKLASLHTRRTAAKASYVAAKAVLAEAKKVTKVVPVDLYPEVVAARAEVDAKRAEVEALGFSTAANQQLLQLTAAISAGAKDIPLTIEEISLKDARLSSAAAGKPQRLRLKMRLTQPGRDPLLIDETLRINMMKPGEMDLLPLARTLRRAIVEADRLAKQSATDKAMQERQRKKPKRSKR
ncbi:MAG: hypothetical protein J0M02_08415 [Planctomycetes bacterium]|nr:hypothetical protein [Planctomycetota bacterium]